MKLVVSKSLGFSLIELMVVVVIIGILASVAVPSYNAYVENGRRAEGKAFALDIASRQERHFTQFSRYANNLTANGNAGLGMDSGSSENGNYTGVAVTSAANGHTAYEIQVTPVINDTCGMLTLTHTGARTPGGDCWR